MREVQGIGHLGTGTLIKTSGQSVVIASAKQFSIINMNFDPKRRVRSFDRTTNMNSITIYWYENVFQFTPTQKIVVSADDIYNKYYNGSPTRQERVVKEIIFHPNCNMLSDDHNIAVLIVSIEWDIFMEYSFNFFLIFDICIEFQLYRTFEETHTFGPVDIVDREIVAGTDCSLGKLNCYNDRLS